jgi:hypothetical protein
MENKTSANANASLTLGIISVILLVLPGLSLIGLVLGIIGLVLSHSIRHEEQVAHTGFVLSLIGLIGNGMLILLIVSSFLFAFAIPLIWWI